MRVQLELDKEGIALIDDLKALTGLKRHQDFFNSAVTVLGWVVLQRLLGWSVVSVNDGTNLCKELVMPSLDRVAHLDEQTKLAAIRRLSGKDCSDPNVAPAVRTATAG